MDSHPVPKNVLTVEFKLFGPLTISQFVRILVSCLAGLFIFLFTPASIRLFMIPVIAIIVGLGAISALVEGFETKIVGMLKAIFRSTQYVWQKQTDVPDVLKQTEAKKVENQGRKKMESIETSLDDLSIENILDARRQAPSVLTTSTAGAGAENTAEPDSAAELDYKPAGSEEYFNKIYDDVFKDRPNQAQGQQVVQQAQGLAGGNNSGQTISMGDTMHVENKPVQNNQPRPKLSNPPQNIQNVADPSVEDGALSSGEKQEKIKELTGQISMLRTQLKSNDPNVRKQVTADIKKLFDEIQLLAGRHPQQEQVLNQTQAMFGVVVDKQNNPLPGAQVGLFGIEDTERMFLNNQTGNDGRFNFDLEGLPRTSYIVKVSHPQFKFPLFRVDLATENLPGFKFRAN